MALKFFWEILLYWTKTTHLDTNFKNSKVSSLNVLFNSRLNEFSYSGLYVFSNSDLNVLSNSGFKDQVKGKVGEIQMDPKLKEAGWEKYAEFKVLRQNQSSVRRISDGLYN